MSCSFLVSWLPSLTKCWFRLPMVLRRQATQHLALLVVAVQHSKHSEDGFHIFDVWSLAHNLKCHRVVFYQRYLTPSYFSCDFTSWTHFLLLHDSLSDLEDFELESALCWNSREFVCDDGRRLWQLQSRCLHLRNVNLTSWLVWLLWLGRIWIGIHTKEILSFF
jgi:hypothetical protein